MKIELVTCVKCGSTIKSDLNICPNCGTHQDCIFKIANRDVNIFIVMIISISIILTLTGIFIFHP